MRLRWRLFKALFTRDPAARCGEIVWPVLYERDKHAKLLPPTGAGSEYYVIRLPDVPS